MSSIHVHTWTKKIKFLFSQVSSIHVHTWTKKIKFLFRKWALFMFTLGPRRIKFLFRKWALFMFTLGPRKLKFLFCKWALFMFTLWTHVVPALFLNPSTQASKQASKAGTTWVQINVQIPVSYVEGEKKKKNWPKKKPPSLPVLFPPPTPRHPLLRPG